jgi:uncharacterized RDD family membrane protein YckC
VPSPDAAPDATLRWSAQSATDPTPPSQATSDPALSAPALRWSAQPAAAPAPSPWTATPAPQPARLAGELTPPPQGHPADQPALLTSARPAADLTPPHQASPADLLAPPAAQITPVPQARHPTPLPQPPPTLPPHGHPTPQPFVPAIAVPLPPVPAAAPQVAPRSRRDAAAVHVVGFWFRLVAAAIDLAIVLPAAVLIAMLASWATGLHLPTNLHVLDIDLWIDLVLASDPALVMGLVLLGAIGLTYLLVFQIIVGQTLGMRLLRIKIIDVYGDRPSAPRCIARCAGYLAGVATLFLGFLWMGFDSEKRGLQDWIAGTYVIRG